MRVAIHQPNYLPWMGYIQKIASVDIFIFLDDVQYSNEGGHNRNLIKTPNGKLFLTVPVDYHLGNKINEVITKDNLLWKEKHLKTIAMSYKKAPYFKECYLMMENLLLTSYENIAELNAAIIVEWCRRFGITTEFKWASSMELYSTREDKVIDICSKLSADCYYSGNGARSYQVEEHFTNKNIKLEYQNYKPLFYPQLWGDFEFNLSALDYMMNCGFHLQGLLREE